MGDSEVGLAPEDLGVDLAGSVEASVVEEEQDADFKGSEVFDDQGT